MAFIYVSFSLYDFPTMLGPGNCETALAALLADYAADPTFQAIYDTITVNTGVETVTPGVPFDDWVPPTSLQNITINGSVYPYNGNDPHVPSVACSNFFTSTTYARIILLTTGGFIARVQFRGISMPPPPSPSSVGIAPRPATIPIGGNIKNSLPCERQIKLGM